MRTPSYEVVSPEGVESGTVICMPNIMGGALDFPGNAMGDHLYRADYVARELGVHVVAYERPGTGRNVFDMGAHSAVQPSEYVRAAAWRASQLQAEATALGATRTLLFGASAGGTDAIALAQTGNLSLDALAIYDPIGVRQTTWHGGFMDWARHQKREAQRPAQLRNQHPMEAPSQPAATLQIVAGLARTAVEMYHYGNMWRRPESLHGLQRLISAEEYGHIALLAAFPALTFTDKPAAMGELAQSLQAQADESGREAPADFQLARRYHSWTDDPANIVSFVAKAQAMVA